MKRSFFFLLLFSSIFFSSFAQWSSNPTINTPVCIQANDQQDLRIVTDNKGGAIIAWLDYRADATQQSGDIYIQRLDQYGNPKWTANGVVLCNLSTDQTAPSIVEDGNGGAIIAWNDWRNGNRDIYAQKIDSSGNLLWAANGVSVVVKANHQQDSKLIGDDLGGAIVVWQDSISNNTYDVYAQHINSSGVATWTAGGVVISNSLDSQINPRIETDNAGGGIVTWQDKRNGTHYDIYAQRISSTGVVAWTANGVAVCNAANTQSNPKIEPDGAGGAYITWQDKRNGVDYDVYVQQVNSLGTMQWTVNGIVVCSSTGSQSAIDMTSKGVSGAIITWKDQRNGDLDIYTQKINQNGVVAWTTNGVVVAAGNAPQINPSIISDVAGGAIIAWQDSTSGNWDVKAQRIDANGIIKWIPGGASIGTAADNQRSGKNVSDGNGGSIFAWEDKRNTTDYNIYAHYLPANGISSIHEPNVFVESTVFPNPFNQSACIKVTNNKLYSLYVLVFDMMGKEVYPNVQHKNGNLIINRDALSTGIYFYQVKLFGQTISNGKFIITD